MATGARREYLDLIYEDFSERSREYFALRAELDTTRQRMRYHRLMAVTIRGELVRLGVDPATLEIPKEPK